MNSTNNAPKKDPIVWILAITSIVLSIATIMIVQHKPIGDALIIIGCFLNQQHPLCS